MVMAVILPIAVTLKELYILAYVLKDEIRRARGDRERHEELSRLQRRLYKQAEAARTSHGGRAA